MISAVIPSCRTVKIEQNSIVVLSGKSDGGAVHRAILRNAAMMAISTVLADTAAGSALEPAGEEWCEALGVRIQ